MCTACNNWLDIQPSDRIAEDRVFSSVSGFWGALNGVYTELLSSNLYGSFLTVQGVEVMAQRYNVSQSQEMFYNLSQYAFTQEQVKLQLESYWNEAYKQVLECNNILENAGVRHRRRPAQPEPSRNAPRHPPKRRQLPAPLPFLSGSLFLTYSSIHVNVKRPAASKAQAFHVVLIKIL